VYSLPPEQVAGDESRRLRLGVQPAHGQGPEVIKVREGKGISEVVTNS
jgi:hypothetical protein